MRKDAWSYQNDRGRRRGSEFGGVVQIDEENKIDGGKAAGCSDGASWYGGAACLPFVADAHH